MENKKQSKKPAQSSPSQDPLSHKTKATVTTHGIDNTSVFEHPASFAATAHKLEATSLKSFIQNCDVEIRELTEDEIVFDLKGVEPPLANALRRILIAEIPTMAVEKVNMWQNTGVIPDENLAHRIGLVPIKADARMFEWHQSVSYDKEDKAEDPQLDDYGYTGSDCLKFKLHVKCTKKDPSAPMIVNNTVDEDKFYVNANVLSGQMEWVPLPGQKREWNVRPLHDDILIAKLRPGQEIEMELFCEKGIGKTHAKWSPVATAYYRLVPDITLKQEITGTDARELKAMCPMGVFDIEDIANKSKLLSEISVLESGKDNVRAVVADARKCTTCRECIRPDKFKDKIEIAKVKD